MLLLSISENAAAVNVPDVKHYSSVRTALHLLCVTRYEHSVEIRSQSTAAHCRPIYSRLPFTEFAPFWDKPLWSFWSSILLSWYPAQHLVCCLVFSSVENSSVQSEGKRKSRIRPDPESQSKEFRCGSRVSGKLQGRQFLGGAAERGTAHGCGSHCRPRCRWLTLLPRPLLKHRSPRGLDADTASFLFYSGIRESDCI